MNLVKSIYIGPQISVHVGVHPASHDLDVNWSHVCEMWNLVDLAGLSDAFVSPMPQLPHDPQEC